MKKICIVRHGYFPSDVRVRKEALALVEKGNTIDVICLQEEGMENIEKNGNINIYRLPVKHLRKGMIRYLFEYFSFFFLAATKLSFLSLKKRYDVIQINTLPDFLVFVAILPKLLGAKVILDLHEPSPELWSTKFGRHKKLLIRIVSWVEQLSIKFSNHAITVSNEMRDNYIKRGALPSKISVILNVPNLEFNPDLYQKKKRPNKDRFLLICHGAMLERYGQDTAIKAIQIVKEQIPNVLLNILGYGEYEDELKRLTNRLNLENYINFLGFIPYLDMIQLIHDSEIGIVPVEKNNYSDLVHTNKMFEYISMKKPVVISRTNAVESFFGNDNRCLKFFESKNENDLARCIIELYHDPDIRKEMVKNAYEKFALFRWEITKEHYCALF